MPPASLSVAPTANHNTIALPVFYVHLIDHLPANVSYLEKRTKTIPASDKGYVPHPS